MLFIIICLVFIMVASFIVSIRTHDDCGIGTFGFSALALICIGVMHIPIINHHCDSLATIKSADSLIAVYTESLSDLDKQMESLSKDIDNKTLFNADSPYRTLIQTKADYVSKVAKARFEIVDAKREIQARKLGFMSHIVRWYGEE